tara:strand:- start:92 stop:385 length:294 start_codon:yes stop_codon:yes gene_type:complete
LSAKKNPAPEAGAGFFEKYVRALSDGFFDHVDCAVKLIKSNTAVLECEQSVVAAHAYIGAWVETSAALTDNDVTRDDSFAAEFFNAEALCIAVATVT